MPMASATSSNSLVIELRRVFRPRADARALPHRERGRVAESVPETVAAIAVAVGVEDAVDQVLRAADRTAVRAMGDADRRGARHRLRICRSSATC